MLPAKGPRGHAEGNIGDDDHDHDGEGERSADPPSVLAAQPFDEDKRNE